MVITNTATTGDLRMPIRPAIYKLRLLPDVSYLIVGGLRGVCGTLAVHMAQHGARNIVVVSRSGVADNLSARIVQDCLSHGCRVVEAKGDVGDFKWVKALVATTVPRIAGVIQGAMILRVSPRTF